MQRKLVKAALGVIVVGAAGITAASAAPSPDATPNTGTGLGLAVVVENKATQPIPVAGSVSGTVNVGNLPATQQVAGTVSVGNLPATQNVAGTVNVANLPATQNVHVVPPTNQVLMQAEADLTDNGQPGLTYVKLLNETNGSPTLSGRFAVSSVTVSQFGGDQPIQVSLRAASCDNSNGLGAIGDVVVPQDQTVQLPYPTPVLMPFVPSVPAAWCLFAQTVADNGRLSISVVGSPSS
jgi:hypothetical protein